MSPLVFVAVAIVVVGGAIFLGVAQSGPDAPARNEVARLPEPMAVPTAAAQLTPRRYGDLTAWPMPRNSGPWGVTVTDEGAVWVAETLTPSVGRLSEGSYTRYRIAAVYPDPGVFHLAIGRGGDVWFTGYTGAGIGRVRPDGRVNYFDAPTPQTRTSVDVASAPDGAVWVTDAKGGALVRVVASTPASVRSVEVRAPVGSDKTPQPYEIRPGSDGAMWFTDPTTNAVGRATLDGREAGERTYDLPKGVSVRGLATSDGVVWVALTPGPGRLLRIDERAGDGSVVDVEGADSGFVEVAAAPDGSLWVPQIGALLHIRPDGSLIRRVPLPSKNMSIAAMTVASDGTLWATSTEDDVLLEVAPTP